MKKLLTLTLTAAILVCAFVLTAGAAFDKMRNYDGQFGDISENAWYASSVKECYEMGLISGQSETTFNPQGMFTVAQALTVAARMHDVYGGGDGNIPSVSGAWYSGAVNYCIENGIIKNGEFSDYNRYVTRAEMAGVMVAALPKSEWKAINNVSVLPDVENNGGKNENAIFTLYNAGILAGSDEYGKFQPNAAITRAEVAALIVRMADKSARISVNLKPLSERDAVEISGYFCGITDDGKVIFGEDGKYGVMTTYGEVIIPCVYHNISYENGRFLLEGQDANNNYVIWVADTSGKMLYTFNNSVKSLGEDYFIVGKSIDNTSTLYKGDKLIVSDFYSAEIKDGYVILARYEKLYTQWQFASGYSAYALADMNGKILIDYKDGEIFIYDDYIVRVANREYTFYDKSGNLLCFGEYYSVNFDEGLMVYSENGKYGLASVHGNVVDAMYDRISLSGKFAVLEYGTMCALAGVNGIIFDFGEYTQYGLGCGDYAIAKRDGALDIVDITGDVLATVEGDFEVYADAEKSLIRFGYLQYNRTGFYRLEYNFAFDTVSKQVLKCERLSIGNYNYVTYYKNSEKSFLANGIEIEKIYAEGGYAVYRSVNGKYGTNWTDPVYDTPKEAINPTKSALEYTVATENGKPVVKYGDEAVIKYYKAPFYYDRIDETGYNNYFVCTFNDVQYLIHP